MYKHTDVYIYIYISSCLTADPATVPWFNFTQLRSPGARAHGGGYGIYSKGLEEMIPGRSINRHHHVERTRS